MLIVLRRMLAKQIDGGELKGAPLAAAVRQFREINADITAIDVRAAEAAALAVAGDDGGDAGDDGAWDESKI